MSPPPPNTTHDHSSTLRTTPDPDLDPDSDILLASLEAEVQSYHPTPSARESLAQALAEETRAARQYSHLFPTDSEHLIQSLASDDSVLKFTTQHPACLVHFAHKDFARCGVMDLHLQRLQLRHGDEGVRFGRVNVEDAPFVVGKLGVRVLPCVVGFRDGVAVGRMVGFEGVSFARKERGGGTGEEEGEGAVRVTREIERVVVGWGVFGAVTRGWEVSGVGSGSGSEDEDEEEGEGRRRRNGGIFGNANANGNANRRRGIRGRKTGVAGSDDDDDWD